MGEEAWEGRSGRSEGRGVGPARTDQNYGAEDGAGESEEGQVGARAWEAGEVRAGGAGEQAEGDG